MVFVTSKQPTPFLQSAAWAHAQEALGRRVLQRNGTGWSYLAIVERGRLGSRLYLPLGPVFDDAAALEAALADLQDTAKSEGVDFVRVEPSGPLDIEETVAVLSALGARRALHEVQPACTVINELSMAEEDLVDSFTSAGRRNWRKGMRSGLEVEHSKDPKTIEIFLAHIEDVAQRTGFRPHSEEYFRTVFQSLLDQDAGGYVLVHYQGEAIASLFYYRGEGQIMFAHAASYTRVRDLNPSYALAVEALRLGLQEGDAFLDFAGAAPEDATKDHPLYGITEFKLRFGGKRVLRPGTWELPVRNLRYRLYRTTLRIAESLRSVRGK